MRKKLVLFGLMLSVLLCAACDASGSYQSREHYSNRSELGAIITQGGNIVSDKVALRQAIINTIEARRPKEELIIQGYDGDLDADYEEIRNEMLSTHPDGVYAVDTINIIISRHMLAQTKLEVGVIYRDSAVDPRDITVVPDVSDFEAQVTRLLRDFTVGPGSDDATSRVFSFTGFADTPEELEARLYKCWSSSAVKALDLREISAVSYPENAENRYVEVNIQYLEPRGKLAEKSNLLQQRAREVVLDFSGTLDRERIDFIYDWLWRNVAFESSSLTVPAGDWPVMRNPYTAYGGLVDRAAVQEGYALAAQLLCENLGLSSQLVIGRQGERQHYYWIYVNVDGQWMHFDPSAMQGIEPPDAVSDASDESVELTFEEQYAGHVYLFSLEEGDERFSWDDKLYSLPR